VGVIHRYNGEFDWEGVERGTYPPERNMKGVSVRWLIGPAEAAPNYALRYFGDVIYVPGDQVHQFRNTGDEPFGFFCVIPALD
jgi:hypothetical protein